MISRKERREERRISERKREGDRSGGVSERGRLEDRKRQLEMIRGGSLKDDRPKSHGNCQHENRDVTRYRRHAARVNRIVESTLMRRRCAETRRRRAHPSGEFRQGGRERVNVDSEGCLTVQTDAMRGERAALARGQNFDALVDITRTF